jgi:hypothetical protein
MFSPKQEPEKVMYFPKQADLQNDVQGTIIFEFFFPRDLITIDGKLPDTILFLNSDVIKGLKIAYSVEENKIYGGLPLMSSVDVDILDESSHQLAYTFSRNDAKQSLFLDGNMIAEAEFSGNVDLVTGMMIYSEKEYIESPIGIIIKN